MKTNQRLMKLLSLIPGLFAMAVVFGLLGSALVIFQSLEMSKAVDGVFLQKQTLASVLPILRVILLVILIRVLFTILNNWLVNLVAIRIKGNLREQLIQKIDRLGPVYLRQSKSGELVTAAIQGIESIDAYFSQYIPQIIIAAAMPLMILAVIFPIDWLSGLVFLITAPLIPFFMVLVGRSSEVQTKKQFLALSRMGADFLDTLQGLTTLKTLGRSRQYATHVEQVSERYREATIQVLRITFLSAFVLELLATISTAVVAVEIGLRLLYGRILFEQAFFILLIAPEFYLPMRNLGMRYHAGMTGVSAAARIFEVMDLPEPKSEHASMRTETTLDLKIPFTLKLRNVSFTYPGRESMALKNVDLEFASGKQYVLVGHSGAGKSTVMQLLMRFLQPTQGTITMDGLDIQRIDLQDWRSQIAWVPQRPKLFDTSLLENIRLNRREISEEAVWQALDFARLKEFTKHLPEGLHTPLREWGSRLSGGQAQRVALARAFVKEAPLLLMDEPTSFLDPVLEMELEQASALLLKGRTSITIAHRYSTAVSADEVIALEKGRVVQIGNHQSLITQEGPYSRLFSASESGQ